MLHVNGPSACLRGLRRTCPLWVLLLTVGVGAYSIGALGTEAMIRQATCVVSEAMPLAPHVYACQIPLVAQVYGPCP